MLAVRHLLFNDFAKSALRQAVKVAIFRRFEFKCRLLAVQGLVSCVAHEMIRGSLGGGCHRLSRRRRTVSESFQLLSAGA